MSVLTCDWLSLNHNLLTCFVRVHQKIPPELPKSSYGIAYIRRPWPATRCLSMRPIYGCLGCNELETVQKSKQFKNIEVFEAWFKMRKFLSYFPSSRVLYDLTTGFFLRNSKNCFKIKWFHVKAKKQGYIKLDNNRGLNPSSSTEPILRKS